MRLSALVCVNSRRYLYNTCDDMRTLRLRVADAIANGDAPIQAVRLPRRLTRISRYVPAWKFSSVVCQALRRTN